jgi:hypothetical protein
MEPIEAFALYKLGKLNLAFSVSRKISVNSYYFEIKSVIGSLGKPSEKRQK